MFDSCNKKNRTRTDPKLSRQHAERLSAASLCKDKMVKWCRSLPKGNFIPTAIDPHAGLDFKSGESLPTA